MLAGTLGGLLATWVTFAPCFLWIFLGAPFIETLRGNKALAGALGASRPPWSASSSTCRSGLRCTRCFARWPVRAFGLSFDAGVGERGCWALVLAVGAAIAIFRFKAGMLTMLVGHAPPACCCGWRG